MTSVKGVRTMSNMNFNLYKIFCVVAETESFSKAREILYLTEPTISSHITKLENELGVKLFYRENKGTTLTREGKKLYDDICDKIKDIEFAENAIMQDTDISKAKITIGCPSHIAISYLSKCVTKIKKDYPNLKIDIIGETGYENLTELLEKHKIDFAIMGNVPEIKAEMQIKEIKEIENIFISKELIKIKDIKELENYRYILNYKDSNSTKKLLEILKKHNVQIQADMQSDITEMRIEEVKQGQGIGYVMKEAAREAINSKEVYEVKLPIQLPKMKINVVYMEKYLTKIDKIFIKKYLKED